MRQFQILRRITTFLLMCGLLLPAVPARGRAGAAASLAVPDYKTIFHVREINALSGAVGGVTESQIWPLNRRGGISLVRPFRVGSNNFIFFLRKHSGEAFIQQLGPNGQLGATTDYRNLEAGWTAADFIYFGANAYLVLHNSFTGQVRTHQVLANGKFAAQQNSELASPNLQDTHLFSPYFYNGQWRMFALDPWTGVTVTSSGNWTNMTTDQWTRGWTSLDHLTVGGIAYRLVYKAAGDPLEAGTADTDQLGRFVVQRIGADGVTPQNIHDEVIAGGWSSVSFVPSSGEALSINKILFYRNDTGEYQVRGLFAPAGVGPVITSGNIGEGYTDLKAAVVGGRILLTALNEENAEAFTAANAERMALTIHNELKNKTIGYQFLLMQSGKVIYSRAHGLTRLAPTQVPMTTRTRLDLGSVGKMITTMTTLKLVEQGKLFLYNPITEQIDANKYPSVHDWVKQRNLIDLMKQTTGFERNSPGCVGDENTFQVQCQPFFSASPTLECKDGLCPRAYNNANFGALRQVIENASGTTTTAQLVQFTHDLWAKKLDLGGSNAIACSTYPNAHSFQRCAGSEGCINYNGVWWQQEVVEKQYSASCGAGGWHASARQMGEFMSAARYAKVLTDNVNDLFMSTEHTALVDDAPEAGATAIGWEPAWQVEGSNEKLLHKDGDRIGVAYVTQLPNRLDAILIVNTSLANHPKGLLRDAYKYAAGLSPKLPTYVEVTTDGSATAGAIGEVAVNTISSAAGGQFATAVRNSDGQLNVIGWNRTTGGSLIREGTTAAGAASEIAITDGEGFVTALRNGLGNLQLIAWSASSGSAANIKREGSVSAGAVSQVSATKLAGLGSLDGRVATAVRNGEGNLQVDVWDFHNASDQVTRRSTLVGGAVSEVAVKTLRHGSSLNQATRFATAVRNSEGKLQIDIWDVDANGQLTRKGKASASAVTSAAAKNKIAIGRWDDDDIFTASINADGKLEITQWAVSESGLLTKGDLATTGGEVTEIAASGSATVMRLKNDDGTFKLINWRIINGQLVRHGENEWDGKVTQVAATGSVLSATRMSDGTLRLVKWVIID